jgi:hypothetical protein
MYYSIKNIFPFVIAALIFPGALSAQGTGVTTSFTTQLGVFRSALSDKALDQLRAPVKGQVMQSAARASNESSALAVNHDSCHVVETQWPGGNGNDGIMVNIYTNKWIMIEEFAVFINSFDSGYVKIYYRPDTAAGHEQTPADWTFIDSAFVTGNGTAIPTLIPVDVEVLMPAWSMYSFYITGTGTPNIIYSNGTGTAYDSTITIFPGAGLAYPFGIPTDTVYQNRVFNGAVYYCEAAVSVVEVKPVSEISIVPNPFSELTEVVLTAPLKDAEMAIYNMMGQMVKREAGINGQRVTLSREGLAAGVYLLRVSDGSGALSVRKFIVE